jgi:glycosyltransferase involved in cell wall biosynthesis
MPEVVVMVTSSYPRFPGDSVGTFMEPIAHAVAARGHQVHIVAPWHPLVERPSIDRGVHLHFYRYAPARSLNVFGYAGAMRADVTLKAAAFAAAPLALAAGWNRARDVARQYGATVMHGHWVVPGGVTAALARPTLPLVVSLHGSDVFVAERLLPARIAARSAFRRAGFITSCSADLAARAVRLGAPSDRMAVVPYGVDTTRFKPDPVVRQEQRKTLRIAEEELLVVAAGRLVHKKGFEYLIDAMARIDRAVLALAGSGTLDQALTDRARHLGIADRVRFLGNRTQDEVASLFAAADVIVAPSVRDDAGNVDGLPNVVLEALASGTPLITTEAGGIGAVVDHGRTAEVVPERDATAIVDALGRLRQAAARERIGQAARELVERRFGWGNTAAGMENAYVRALAFMRTRR